MIRRALALTVLTVLCLGASFASAVPASAEATIESSTVQNDYPKSLTFKVTAKGDSDITDVTLSYSLVGRGTSALGKPSEFTAAKNLSAEVVVQVNSGQSYIPVGSEFVYSWQVTTADGKTTSSAEQRFFFLPPNQQWKTVQGDFMVVYYHGDKEVLAQTYLKAGLATFDKIGKQLFNIELKQAPVKVILFDDEKESDLARPGAGLGTFDAAVTTCGTKVTIDILLIIPVSCGTSDRTDTLRHEFGHILNQTAGEGSLGKLPSWLDEGTAVYAQTTPGDGYVGAFAAAAKSGRLIPFAQMGTPSGDANRVNLFYGQSWAMAKYLIDKGGPAQYAQFFATIKKGSRFDDALKQVYGFDLAGFEQEFVKAQSGSAPTVAPTTRPAQTSPTALATTRPAQSVATVRPTTAAIGRTQDSGGTDGGIDKVAVGIIGAAVLFALLGVFSFLLANMLGSSRRAPASGGPPPPQSPTSPPPVDWGKKDE